MLIHFIFFQHCDSLTDKVTLKNVARLKKTDSIFVKLGNSRIVVKGMSFCPFWNGLAVLDVWCPTLSPKWHTLFLSLSLTQEQLATLLTSITALLSRPMTKIMTRLAAIAQNPVVEDGGTLTVTKHTWMVSIITVITRPTLMASTG